MSRNEVHVYECCAHKVFVYLRHQRKVIASAAKEPLFMRRRCLSEMASSLSPSRKNLSGLCLLDFFCDAR